MRSATALIFCLLIQSLFITGSRNTSAQAAPHKPVPKSVSQVLLAYSLQEITVKSQRLPDRYGHMNFLALSDKGEVVVGTQYGIYTDKRKVVQAGDVIDGVTISLITDVRVNSQGRIACLVIGDRQKNTPEAHSYCGIFVDDHLAYEYPGGQYSFVFGDTGTPYLISFRSTYTTNGKDWSQDADPLPPDVVRNLLYHFDTSDALHPHVSRTVDGSVFPVGPAWHPFEVPDRLPEQASQMPSGPIITSPGFIPQTHNDLLDSSTLRLGKLFFAPAGLPSKAYGGHTIVDTYYNEDEEPVVIAAASGGRGSTRYSVPSGAVGSGVIWGPRGLVACYLTSTGQITRGFSTKSGFYPFIPNDPIINRRGQLLFQTSGSGNATADGLFKFVLATPDSVPASNPDQDRPRPGDVVLYEEGGEIPHVAIVWHVNDKGQIDVVRSKWGSWPVFDHDPNQGYGTIWSVYRRKEQRENVSPELVNALEAIGNDDQGKLIFKTDNNRLIYGGGELEKLKISDEALVEREHASGLTSVQIVYPSSLAYDCRGFVWANSKEPIPEFRPFSFTDQMEEIIEDGYRQINTLDTDGHAHNTDVIKLLKH